MTIKITEKVGDIKIFGTGSPGGKGAGLIKVNEMSLPMVSKLKTRILATELFDRFLEHDHQFKKK